MDLKKFRNTVTGMSAVDLLKVLKEVLINPVTELDMDTFGNITNGVCYGCLATNAICKIANISVDMLRYKDDVFYYDTECRITTRMKSGNPELKKGTRITDLEYLSIFENYIDDIRRLNFRNMYEYNKRLGIERINFGNMNLSSNKIEFTSITLDSLNYLISINK
jgi:hypothetical protein